MSTWLLSGELGDFLGAFETEVLAERAAWEYSEHESFSKEQTIAYLEENTSVSRIKDVYTWAHEKATLAGMEFLDETEDYAIKNYRRGKVA